ncbi:MAG: glycosyltransferase family 4 protein [Firmicutes bacterium]|nr:glycosyltransferase family 4 protein [Bacillota bacterium]
MKVWIVNHYAIPPAFGGLSRHYYFSNILKKHGVETRIFSSSKIHNTDLNFIEDGNLYLEKLCDEVEYTFIKTSNYKGNGLARIFSFIQFPLNTLRTLRQFYKKEKPDVIYASSPELFATGMAILFARKRKIPTIVEIRDLWPESIVEYTSISRNNPIIKILYGLERWIYTKADRIIFTFEGGADYIKSKGWDTSSGGKIDLDKVRYINNGVDLERFEYDKKNNIIEDEELDRKDTFKVVYTGSVRRVNCVWMLVEAAKKLHEDGIEDVSFIIYGDGTEKEELILECEKHGLNNVHFRSRVEKKYVASILERADLNIFVGEPDSLNQYGLSLNKLFDYMASGKPILSNIKANYDNILKYNCGVVVEDDSITPIYEGILKIKALSQDEYKTYCENAKTAARDFDFEKLTSKLYEIMKEVKEE